MMAAKTDESVRSMNRLRRVEHVVVASDFCTEAKDGECYDRWRFQYQYNYLRSVPVSPLNAHSWRVF